MWRFITLTIGFTIVQRYDCADMLLDEHNQNGDQLLTSSKTAPTSGNSLFALKVLKAEDVNAFALEVKALMKIKPKPHLVAAVTAFK